MKLCKCGALVDKRCERCYPTTHSKTTKERGYGHDWRKLSERLRKESPLCPDCLAEGRSVPATEVHHEVKIKDAPSLRLSRPNLIPLCAKHHALRENATAN